MKHQTKETVSNAEKNIIFIIKSHLETKKDVQLVE